MIIRFARCSPIGKLELHAGDCLLMVADGPEFVAKHRNNSTFALVSKVWRNYLAPIQEAEETMLLAFIDQSTRPIEP